MPSEGPTEGQSVDELRRELTDAREQQAATAEILRVISSSPTDFQRVFADIAASAARLCDAYDASIFQVDGDCLRLVAHYGPIPQSGTLPVTRGFITGRVVLDRQTIHVADIQAETDEYPEGSDAARRLGHRTILAVPLIRAGKAIGVIGIRRTEVRPFTDRQIDLVKTFADQTVIAIENTRLFEAEQTRTRELTERTQELTESLEYQTAISEVLAVISRSPSDLQPVLQAIVETAARLCHADKANIRRKEAGSYRTVASIGLTQAQREFIEQTAIQLDRTTMGGRVALDHETVHVADVLEDRDLRMDIVSGINFRTGLGVPLLRKGELIGLLLLSRDKHQPFSRRQIALVETFAEQAVIAIENTRLFEAEQASKRELQESLEYQTATSGVLGVIAASTTDIQPVLQTLVESACRLCAAYDGIILLREGDWLQVKAHHGPMPANVAKRRITRDWVNGRCVADCVQIHLQDVQAEVAEYPEGVTLARRVGARTILATPLLREGEAIGAMTIRRDEVRPFTDKQIALVKTFADQAVIAIENTRLFEAEQASKRELQESLEYQTATSEVLGAISRTPTELQPVLAEICKTANRLCETPDAAIFLRDGKWLRVGSVQGSIGGGATEKIALTRGFVAARAFLDREVVHVHDLRAVADEYPEGYESSLKLGHRTIIGVPLMRNEDAIGVLILRRSEVKPFTDKQIQVLKTFADQAVIAIENTRLFEEVQARTRELQESLEYQTATSEVLKVISRSAFELQLVIDTLVESAARLCDGDAWLFRRHGDAYYWAASYGFSSEHHERIKAYFKQRAFVPNRGGTGMRAALEGRVVHIVDVLTDPEYAYTEAQEIGGFRSTLAVPLLRDGLTIGVLTLTRSEVRPFTENQIELITTFADQAVIAIENARLFEEVQARTSELAKTVEDLEIASQHKNQFVANMSHELRTPLAAILGYAELIQEGFYEPQGPKSLDALTRIRSNGKHLLGLINTVLDIAKIESGQFTLNMTEYAIESVVETVRSATESLAQNKKLALKTEVAKSLPVGLGDEQRLTQVLLNLVGNAIKFTDAGEVRIAASAVNGHFNVSVTDTGPGIPTEHQARIFEQFHQVDSSNTKAKGGTGLGLAIAKQIVEMHGGRIWVESMPGKGSNFQMELPIRAEIRRGNAFS